MNREIIFRGKDIYDGEWVEGFVTIDPTICEYVIDTVGSHSIPVYHNTVGQYTGLKDKNGVKIFEGDILEHHVQGDVLVNRGVVVWDERNARWGYQLNTMKPEFYLFNSEAWEIIGNIHDNPELLEVAECHL